MDISGKIFNASPMQNYNDKFTVIRANPKPGNNEMCCRTVALLQYFGYERKVTKYLDHAYVLYRNCRSMLLQLRF